MKRNKTRPLLRTTLLCSLLLTTAPAITGNLVINTGEIYDNNFLYLNLPPDEIHNQGTLNNLGLLDNANWISNLGILNNLGPALFINTGTIHNNGGTINNLAGALFDNQSQLTNEAGSTIHNYSEFNSGNISNFGTLINHSGTGHLVVTDGIATYAGGSFTNDGILDVQSGAAITNSGITTNTGSLDSMGQLWNYATMANQGSLFSRFYMDNYGTFDNQTGATLENIGTFWNHGQFGNAGGITSTSWFSNATGATFTNTGTIDNQHKLRNYGAFNNQGDIASNTQVLNEGTFDISGNLTGTGTYQQNAGSTTVNGLLEADFINIDGGVLGGSGTVRGNLVVGPGGAVNPGNSPGTLIVDGDFELAAGSLLTLEVAGTGLTEFDRLIVSGTLDLFGDIRFDLMSGFLLSDLLANFEIGDFFLAGNATTNSPFTDPLMFSSASFSVFDGTSITDLWLLANGSLSNTLPSGPTPTPEPSVLGLVGIGLAGLAGLGVGRRRRAGKLGAR